MNEIADKTDLIHDENADIVHSSERLSKRIRLFRLAFILTLILFILGATTILIMDLWIGLRYRSRLYTDIDTIPHRPVALVLGTAPEFQGRINLFYRARLKAAAALFHAGKVDGLLLSGDNGHKDYNEPEHMKQDLIKLGVPAEFITLDYAGFRTLDSVVRAQAIFNLDTYTVVSQPFHCHRSLFLSDRLLKNNSAIAFAADDVRGKAGAKVRLRETLARVKAFVDVYVLHTKPRFLGKQETIRLRDNQKKPISDNMPGDDLSKG